jgi:hypothetical protein
MKKTADAGYETDVRKKGGSRREETTDAASMQQPVY